jgi:hypothetical protein
MTQNNVREQPETPRPPARRPYSPPRLQRYGHVSKLTGSGGSTRPEVGNPNMRACL